MIISCLYFQSENIVNFEDERRTESAWKTSLIIIKRPERANREAKRNNKIQRTYFSAHKKPFFIREILELAACPSWRRNIGDSNFLFLWNETLQERLASNEQILKNVSAEINSDVGEILCGHSGQIPFTRRARGEIWKLCRSAWILILHEGGALAQKSNSLFSWFWLADWPNTWLWLALIGDQMHRQEGNMKTLQVRDTVIVMTLMLGFLKSH